MFACCSFIIKHDYKVTIYLLPHVLLYMLLGCTEAEQQEVKRFLFCFWFLTFIYNNTVVTLR